MNDLIVPIYPQLYWKDVNLFLHIYSLSQSNFENVKIWENGPFKVKNVWYIKRKSHTHYKQLWKEEHYIWNPMEEGQIYNKKNKQTNKPWDAFIVYHSTKKINSTKPKE